MFNQEKSFITDWSMTNRSRTVNKIPNIKATQVLPELH